MVPNHDIRLLTFDGTWDKLIHLMGVLMEIGCCILDVRGAKSEPENQNATIEAESFSSRRMCRKLEGKERRHSPRPLPLALAQYNKGARESCTMQTGQYES